MDDDLYDELRREFNLPPFHYVFGAQCIRFVALSYLFLDLPWWHRFGACVAQLTLAEIIAATGWPFHVRWQDSP